MNGAIYMFYYEQSFLVKMKQQEIESNAKHAWKWSKYSNKPSRQQESDLSKTNTLQVCCQ
jgi:hypothetical protein